MDDNFYIDAYMNGSMKDCSFDDLKHLEFLGGLDLGYPKFTIRIFTDGETLYTPDRPTAKGGKR